MGKANKRFHVGFTKNEVLGPCPEGAGVRMIYKQIVLSLALEIEKHIVISSL